MADNQAYYVHPSSFVDKGSVIGEGTKIWHFCHIMPDSQIGKDCIIGQNCMIAPHVILGDQVKVQNNVSIYTGVKCEDHVFIGPSVVFTNVMNPRSAIERKSEFQKTWVKNGASIGANATIVCGNTIGAYSMVGAGSVVVNDVPDYALVVGNPAIQIGWVSEAGIRLNFDEKNEACCPQSGQKYKLNQGIVTLISP